MTERNERARRVHLRLVADMILVRTGVSRAQAEQLAKDVACVLVESEEHAGDSHDARVLGAHVARPTLTHQSALDWLPRAA